MCQGRGDAGVEGRKSTLRARMRSLQMRLEFTKNNAAQKMGSGFVLGIFKESPIKYAKMCQEITSWTGSCTAYASSGNRLKTQIPEEA